MNEYDIPSLIESDKEMMDTLRAVRALKLPDWWIGAGFVRNKIWDTLCGQNRTPSGDIDVVYFDPSNATEEQETAHQNKLEEICPTGKWSVTNQARMSAENNDPPYASSLDAISHWPETATAIAVTLDDNGRIIFKATHGTDDLFQLVVRPTPAFKNKMEIFYQRAQKKNWAAKWPKIRFEDAF